MMERVRNLAGEAVQVSTEGDVRAVMLWALRWLAVVGLPLVVAGTVWAVTQQNKMESLGTSVSRIDTYGTQATRDLVRVTDSMRIEMRRVGEDVRNIKQLLERRR